MILQIAHPSPPRKKLLQIKPLRQAQTKYPPILVGTAARNYSPESHVKEVEAVLMPLRSSRVTLSVGWCRLLAACLILGVVLIRM